MRVYVLLFNAGTDNEGIHSVRIGDRDRIYMFESEDDATRYGLMLEAQDFPAPAVEELDAEEIEEFCASTGYECELVPEGALALPPEASVEQTDWQPEVETPELSDLDRIRNNLERLL